MRFRRETDRLLGNIGVIFEDRGEPRRSPLIAELRPCSYAELLLHLGDHACSTGYIGVEELLAVDQLVVC